ncbi:hypothetical protein PR048_002154 [Dryococelus australis]|uniref:Uncharacterized protein n=1 Tax=Dryococelus australis TaxID=614101 RepID=A0ABQ9IJE0_9NEOP|nr:hypothetical protein PR048_002154 [Dryococelus australis]
MFGERGEVLEVSRTEESNQSMKTIRKRGEGGGMSRLLVFVSQVQGQGHGIVVMVKVIWIQYDGRVTSHYGDNFILGAFHDTIGYWKQFSTEIVFHFITGGPRCVEDRDLASAKADRVEFSVEPILEIRMWESCRTMPLIGWFSRGSPIFPSLHSGADPYPPASPSEALETPMFRAAHTCPPLQISLLDSVSHTKRYLLGPHTILISFQYGVRNIIYNVDDLATFVAMFTERFKSRGYGLYTVSCALLITPLRVKVEDLRADDSEAPECKGGGKKRSLRKPADQWHRPARFTNAKIQERPRRESNSICSGLFIRNVNVLNYIGCRGDIVDRQLATHQGETGSIPCGVAPGFLHVGIVADDAVSWLFFSAISVSPAPALRCYSILTSLHPHRLSRPRCQRLPKSLHSSTHSKLHWLKYCLSYLEPFSSHANISRGKRLQVFAVSFAKEDEGNGWGEWKVSIFITLHLRCNR